MEVAKTVLQYKKYFALLVVALFGLTYFGFLKLDFSFFMSQQTQQLLVFTGIILLAVYGWTRRKKG